MATDLDPVQLEKRAPVSLAISPYQEALLEFDWRCLLLVWVLSAAFWKHHGSLSRQGQWQCRQWQYEYQQRKLWSRFDRRPRGWLWLPGLGKCLSRISAQLVLYEAHLPGYDFLDGDVFWNYFALSISWMGAGHDHGSDSPTKLVLYRVLIPIAHWSMGALCADEIHFKDATQSDGQEPRISFQNDRTKSRSRARTSLHSLPSTMVGQCGLPYCVPSKTVNIQ